MVNKSNLLVLHEIETDGCDRKCGVRSRINHPQAAGGMTRNCQKSLWWVYIADRLLRRSSKNACTIFLVLLKFRSKMNCSNIGNMVWKLKIFPTLASAKPKLTRNRPLLPGVRVPLWVVGNTVGKEKRHLVKYLLSA